MIYCDFFKVTVILPCQNLLPWIVCQDYCGVLAFWSLPQLLYHVRQLQQWHVAVKATCMPLLVFHSFVLSFIGNTRSVCVMEVRERLERKCEVLSSAPFCPSGSERPNKPTFSLHRHQCNELHWWTLHHREVGHCLVVLFSVVFHRWGQSLLHTHLQQQKTMVHTFHFPAREQGVHNAWTSSKPAMPQVTAFAGASPRLPRIKANCTLRVIRLTHLGMLFSFFLFDSYWELLAFSCEGAELLATCSVGSHSMYPFSSHCAVLKNKCCFDSYYCWRATAKYYSVKGGEKSQSIYLIFSRQNVVKNMLPLKYSTALCDGKNLFLFYEHFFFFY